MTTSTRLALAGTLCIVTSGATAVRASDDFARVTGRVVMQADAKPISTAVVVVDRDGRRFVVKSDKQGRFSAIGLTPGNVTVSLTSFETNVPTCTIEAGETGDFVVTAYRHAAPAPAERPCTIVPPTTGRYLIH